MNVLEFKHVVSDQLLSALREQAMISSYTAYTTAKGTKVGLEWADADHMDASEITSLIPFKPNGQVFTKFAANAFIGRHTDDRSKRASCVSIALHPSPELFAPVIFYDSVDEDAPIVETYHYGKQPVILNTTVVHAMFNNDHDRYMFQIMYSEDIESFIEAVQR